jgi:ribosomal protein S18 acetylase RimI-like enzyme
LPAGLAARPAGPDDLGAVLALAVRCDLAEVGHADTTADDLLAEWRRPGLDLASDTVMVQAPGGVLVAYAHVYAGEEGDGYVDPEWRDRGLGGWLLRWVAERGGRQLAAAGRREGSLQAWANHDDEGYRRLLEREGYRYERSQLIMRADLATAPQAPVWPRGVALRPFQPGRDARAVYRLVQEAFADVEGQALRSYQQWEQFMLNRADFDAGLWFVAVRGHAPVATALCFDYGSEGWVRQLAVRRRERRQGLGLALLRHAFGVFRLRGRPSAGLSVDADNSTGANRLYERAGMRVLRRFDRYARPMLLDADDRLATRP